MSESYQAWREAAQAGTHSPLSEDRLFAAWQWSQIHGPANSWTGTSGTAALLIRELLRERLHLIAALEHSQETESLRQRGVIRASREAVR